MNSIWPTLFSELNTTTLYCVVGIGVIIFIVLICCVRRKSPHSRDRKIARIMCFCFGMGVAISLNYVFQYGHLGHRLQVLLKTYDSDLGHSTDLYRFLENQNNSRIWFITSTKHSLVQPPVLTKIGQALFPVRDFVTWVIVKAENREEIRNSTISQLTTEATNKILKRFGVPYILLKSNESLINSSWGVLRLSFGIPTEVDGRLTGLIWTLKNVKNGVLMLGHEEYTYDFHLFHEIRNTEKVSAWPVGLDRPLYMSTPVVMNGKRRISGYHDGYKMSWKSLNLDLGGYAINLQYLHANLDLMNLWKLAYRDKYAMESIGIPLADVEPMAEKCTKIYVWRTKVFKPNWPSNITFKTSYRNTNMKTLMRNVYGYKYSSIVHEETEDNSSVTASS